MAFDLPISRPARRRLEKVVPNLRELNLGDTGTPTPTQPPDTGGGNWFQDALSTARRAGEMAGGFTGAGFEMLGRPEPTVTDTRVPTPTVQPAVAPSFEQAPIEMDLPDDIAPENLAALVSQPMYENIYGPEEDTSARITVPMEHWPKVGEDRITMDRWQELRETDPEKARAIMETPIPESELRAYEDINRAKAHRDSREEQDLYDIMGPGTKIKRGTLEYDDWLETTAYDIAYWGQKIIPGQQKLEARVSSLIGQEVPMIDPFTGRPILAAITDINEFARNGGPLYAPTALSIAKEEELLPWYITEPIKLLIDPLNFFPVVGWQMRAARSGVAVGTRGTVQLSGSQGPALTKSLVPNVSTDPYMQSPFVRPISGEVSRQIRVTTPSGIIEEAPRPEELGLSILPETGRVALPQAGMVRDPRTQPGRQRSLSRKLTETLSKLSKQELYPPLQRDPMPDISGAPSNIPLMTQYPPATQVQFPGIGQEAGIVRELTEPEIRRAGPLAEQTRPLWSRRQLYADEGKIGQVGNRAVPVEVGRIMAGGVAEIVSPDQIMVHAPSIAREIFQLEPYRAGLTNAEMIKSLIQSKTPRGVRKGLANLRHPIINENVYGTALGRTHNNNAKKVIMIARAWSRSLSGLVDQNFTVNDRGQVRDLAGIDEKLKGAAPTIQDLAARLPVYWQHLSPDQQSAMLSLRKYSRRMEDALEESGSKFIPDHDRLDIVGDPVRDVNGDTIPDNAGKVLTGFYLHRGSPTVAREMPRERVYLPTIPSQVPGYARDAILPSMSESMEGVVNAEGVMQAWDYPSFREAMNSYVQQIGTSINKAHAYNYTLAVGDPETGMLRSLRAGQVNPELQRKYRGLQSNVKRGLASLKKKAAQSVILRREIGRADTAYTAAENRMNARLKEAGQRVMIRGERLLKSDLDEYARFNDLMEKRLDIARRGMAYQEGPMSIMDNDIFYVNLKEAYELSFQAGNALKDQARVLREKRRLNRKSDRAMLKSLLELDELQSAIRRAEEDAITFSTAGGTPVPGIEPVNLSYHDHVGQLRVSIDKLQDKTDELVDYWMKTIDEVETAEHSKKTAAEIAELADQGASIIRRQQLEEFRSTHQSKMLEREIIIAKTEEDRLARILQREVNRRGKERTAAETRLLNNELQSAKIQERIDGYNDELNSLKREYSDAVEASGRAPVDHDVVPLPGLAGYYWPDAFAQAARKYLKDDPSIAGTQPRAVYRAFNDLYRAARGTLDNSAMMVHLLLSAYQDPVAFAKVMKLSVQSWGGEGVIDAFFKNFDDAAVANGRLTSAQLASRGLAITGADTEMALGRYGVLGAVGNLPGVKQANRAFGIAGDAMRLLLSDDYQKSLMRSRTLDEIIAQGDIEKMTNALNAFTGWSSRRMGGDLGEFLIFAPRFLMARMENLARSIVGTPSVLINPIGPYGRYASPDQRFAARSMLRFIGAGVVLIEAANGAQGHDTDWRPVKKINEGTPNERWVVNTNFARVRTPWGTDVSIFGTWDSILGLMITSALVTEGGGPHQAIRSMGSGIVTNVWDIISGTDAMGKPVGTGSPFETTDLARIMAHIMGNFIPFQADDLPRAGKDIKEDLVSGNPAHAIGRLSELIAYTGQGGKSSPMSITEQRNELRQNRLDELYRTGHFDYLPEDGPEELAIKRAVNSGVYQFSDAWADVGGDVKALVDEDTLIQEKTAEREEALRKKRDKGQAYRDERDVLLEHRNQSTEEAWLANGELPTKKFQAALKKINDEYRNVKDALREDPDYKDYLASYEKSGPPEAQLDAAIERLVDIYADPELVDESLVKNYGEQDARLEALEADIGTNLMKRAQAHLDRNDHPGEKAVREIQDTMRPYWDIAETVEQAIYNSERYNDVEKTILYKYKDSIRNRESGGAAHWRSVAGDRLGSSIITDYDRRVSDWRIWMRTTDPEGDDVYANAGAIDEAFNLGYGTTARSKEGAVAQASVIEQQLAQQAARLGGAE